MRSVFRRIAASTPLLVLQRIPVAAEAKEDRVSPTGLLRTVRGYLPNKLSQNSRAIYSENTFNNHLIYISN